MCRGRENIGDEDGGIRGSSNNCSLIPRWPGNETITIIVYTGPQLPSTELANDCVILYYVSSSAMQTRLVS